ncbi:flagellar hook-length control protein FliK [Sphingosinithalassobacter portus]|uniref:flagellar hook-length control protein FliK n=1 Tax=Stakelama portus TaxID=2676234 RepID=UPI000D6E4599|nr:flagellar hook-length control protein FliK [Sphingosinithalassobacter portus]
MQISAISVAGPASVRPESAPLSAGSSGFAIALADVRIDRTPDGKLAGHERQAIAGSGKNLPVAAAGDGETEEDGAEDVLFGWMPGVAPQPDDSGAAANATADRPAPVLSRTPLSRGLPGGADAGSADAATAPQTAPAQTGGIEVSNSASRTAAAPLPPFGGTVGSGPQGIAKADGAVAPASTTPPMGGATVQPAIPTVPNGAPSSAVAPVQAESVSSAIQTAGAPNIALAAALPMPANPLVRDIMPRAAIGDWALEDRRAPGAATGGTGGLEALIAGGAGAAADVRAVAAAAGGSEAQLDMTGDGWVEDMIDHIDVLRDAGGTRVARLRLSPDALGRIDISVHRQGDSTHVRIDAHEHAARAMLADAAPRLTELAEARGIRLSQTLADAGQSGAGTAGGEQRPAAPAQPVLSDAPAAARAGDTAEDILTDRIA